MEQLRKLAQERLKAAPVSISTPVTTGSMPHDRAAQVEEGSPLSRVRPRCVQSGAHRNV
jgi:hypothetical protein